MTAEQAILDAMRAFGTEVRIADVEKWIATNRADAPKDIGTAMADLTFPPSPSSKYQSDRCFLHRTGRGVYRLRRAWNSGERDELPRKARTSRKQLIEANGATCANWTWSWSFVDAERRIIIFGAWDMHTEGNRALILSEAWKSGAEGRGSSGYSQSREHIRLIEEQEYSLYTFPMFNSNQNVGEDGGGPAVIDAFVPELRESMLINIGSNWYASDGMSVDSSPDEVSASASYPEGLVRTVTIIAIERNRKAREACIAHYRAICAVCEFDFESAYGPIACGLIHVHHRKLLAGIGAVRCWPPRSNHHGDPLAVRARRIASGNY